jgi:hypothetical protein
MQFNIAPQRFSIPKETNKDQLDQTPDLNDFEPAQNDQEESPSSTRQLIKHDYLQKQEEKPVPIPNISHHKKKSSLTGSLPPIKPK